MDQSLHYRSQLNQKEVDVVDSYSFHCYIATLILTPKKDMIEYNVKYNSFTYNNLKDFHHYEKEVQSLLENLVLQQKDFCTFSQLYNHLMKVVKHRSVFPEHFLIPVLFRALNLEKIAPLLIDEQIDEIYMDSSKKNLYIDHFQHGRCSTNIKLTKTEIESFVHRVALENDFSLNRSNPTMKSDFVSPLFHTRVTVDIPPLIIEDIHVDIRKFHSKKLSLPDLVKIGSITLSQAKFLIFLVQNQTSISRIGRSNYRN